MKILNSKWNCGECQTILQKSILLLSLVSPILIERLPKNMTEKKNNVKWSIFRRTFMWMHSIALIYFKIVLFCSLHKYRPIGHSVNIYPSEVKSISPAWVHFNMNRDMYHVCGMHDMSSGFIYVARFADDYSRILLAFRYSSDMSRENRWKECRKILGNDIVQSICWQKSYYFSHTNNRTHALCLMLYS